MSGKLIGIRILYTSLILFFIACLEAIVKLFYRSRKSSKRSRGPRMSFEKLESRWPLAFNMLPLADINANSSNTETFEYAQVGPITFFIGATNTDQGL